ncbi:MAG: hypothetical protein ABJA81_05075, partial [Nocardioidaceae bacterium]
GRWLWKTLVGAAGILAEPLISPLALLFAGAAVLCIAALVALGPGVVAARVKPAAVLAAQ